MGNLRLCENVEFMSQRKQLKRWSRYKAVTIPFLSTMLLFVQTPPTFSKMPLSWHL